MKNRSAQNFSESHHFISNDILKAVQSHTLNVDNYLHEETHGRVRRIVDSNNLLRDIDEPRCHDLGESLRNYKYEYAREMMKAYSTTTVNLEAARYATVVHTVDSMTLLKDSFCTVIIDGCHRHRSVEMLRNKYGVR